MSKKLIVTLALLCAAAATVTASTFTWQGKPSSDWNDGKNWTEQSLKPPPGPTDEALFDGVSGIGATTTVAVDAPTAIGNIVFAPTASSLNYNITGTSTLTVNGVAGNAGTVAIVNNSTAAQTFTVENLALGNSQTWNAASGALVIDSAVAMGAYNLTVTGSANTTVGGDLSSDAHAVLTKSGTGTLNLNGGTTAFLGDTVVNAGTLSFGTEPGNGGGAITLNGGTLTQIAGIDTEFSQLTVGGNAAIDLPTSGSLTFGSAVWNAGTLTVNNWVGTAGETATGSAGIFITGSIGEGFLDHVSFDLQGTATGAMMNGTELVPVPEPSTYAAIFALGLLGFAVTRRYMLARA